MTEVSTNFLPALPEIVLAVGTMLLLLLGAYRKSNALGIVSLGSVVLLVALFIIILGWGEGTVRTFGGMFVMDGFGVFMKELILLGAAASIVVSIGYLRRERLDRFEFPILTLLSVLGMMIMVSANDLISLYVGLEMQSLALYVLAAFGRDTLRSTEAGLKYFVLGALSSGFLLYGASLVYGFTGATNFQSIAMSISASPDVSVGVIFGIVFILAGLAFKVSAVPFHMWTPDVYEGSPTPVTTFFATAPKVAAMGLLVRVMTTAFPGLLDQWQQIIVFISIASMALGAFAAIGQTNIKRMMAYSAIGHIGYAMLGLAAGTQQGVQSIIIYLSIYIVMTFGAFVVILAMRRPGGMVEDISDLAGLSKTNPILAFAMAIMMFSLAGIPPLGGFFAKFYVFMAAIDANLVALSIIGVVTSVVGAFYYLRVVKVMYFDEPAPEFLPSVDKGTGALLAASSVAILLFFLGSGVLVSGAGTAAAALFH